jgi:hypothetical protein
MANPSYIMCWNSGEWIVTDCFFIGKRFYYLNESILNSMHTDPREHYTQREQHIYKDTDDIKHLIKIN